MSESKDQDTFGLFDFSFSVYITEDLIRVLYIFAIALAIVAAIAGIIYAFTIGFWNGIVGLLIAPILFFVYIFFARVAAEFAIVIFRVADYTRQIAENTRKE
ncbi:MAG: DUF4282 domain-containing protein [Anaerolineales bacterium]|nr:DUF4282 domain-containing protein [Anaerolineales bacterium]